MKLDRLWADADALAAPFASLAPYRANRQRAASAPLVKILEAGGLTAAAYAGYERELIAAQWPREGELLLDGLVRHACALLYPDGAVMRLRVDAERPGLEILRWRCVTLRIPAHVLVAAASSGVAPAPRTVELLDRTIAPSTPVAHLHQHAGAAYPFPLLWTATMVRAGARSPGKAPDGLTDDQWSGLLLRCAMARRVLAWWRRRPVNATDHRELWRLLESLWRGQLGRDAPVDRKVWQRRARSGRLRGPVEERDVWARDPLYEGRPAPELDLLARSFRLRDPLARRLLLSYLRVQTLLFRAVVSPSRPGLAPFRRAVGAAKAHGITPRLGVATSPSPKLRLCATEFRAPVSKLRNLGALVSAAAKLPGGYLCLGLSRSGGSPRHPARQGDLYRRVTRAARVLVAAFVEHPTWLRTIRGLDLFGEERAGPLWGVVDAIRHVRRAADHAATLTGYPTIGLTLHAGEDFRHLASGLRAVHEPYEWGLMRRGDRLGHATALGTAAASWTDRFPVVPQPRWERMFDLSWLLDRAEREGGMASGCQRLRAELIDHEEAVGFGRGDTRRLRKALGLAPSLSIAGYPARSCPPGLQGRVLGAFLYGPRARLDEVVDVPTGADAPMMAAVAKRLGAYLADFGTVIEVNPTSNLVVGGLEQLVDQPIFQLRPVDPNARHVLPVALSTDDPINFATSLSDEFAYAWAGLTVGAQRPARYVAAWLEDAAAASRRGSFLPPGPRSM